MTTEIIVKETQTEDGRWVVECGGQRYDNNGKGYKNLDYARKLAIANERRILRWLDGQKILANSIDMSK